MKEALQKIINHPIIKKLSDIDGWKNDLPRIGRSLLLGGLVTLGIWVFADPKWDIRFQSPLIIERLPLYESPDGKVSFRHPKRFLVDANEDNRYGSNFLSGIHLEHDRRTGCDIRITDTGINFEKEDREIETALEKEIASTAQGFEKRSSERILLSDRPAFRFEFSFIDPLGSRIRINQAMTSNKDTHYLILCGGNIDIYPLLEKDFRSFFETLKLN